MLTRAESRREVIDKFIMELGVAEHNTEKRRKIMALSLDEEEWTRVMMPSKCSCPMHAAWGPMHAAWEKASSKPRYVCFAPALDAGMKKLDEYYQRSAASD
ncbi:hypothetical protein EDB84DRAFT_1570927 [Lactarius hengduanensis]|nr:hypothetical protein EDB84DRAFT_1570927 [Lactarius hengduanensis]